MPVPELIKRLSRETKVQIVVSEARTGDFATSELAELLDLLPSGPSEKAALAAAVLEALAASGTPAGRVEDLRKAFGAPTAAGRTTPAPPTRLPAQGAPVGGATSQQTRPMQSPFRVRFDAGAPGPVPMPAPAPRPPVERQAPAAPAAPAAAGPAAAPAPPAIPRPPLPLRGKAASILKGGQATAVPPAAAPAAPAAPARPGLGVAKEPVKSAEAFFADGKGKPTGVFFGDGRGKPAAEAVLGPAGQRRTVLLADDDKRIRMIFRIKLEAAGFNVVEAADGQEAWKRLEAGGIDALVLDMKMPGLHGLEILSRLTDAGQSLPVVVCTAHDRMDDEYVVATYPKLRFLTKPVDPAQVAATVASLLAEPA